jgi:hypothetical protein
MGRHDRDELVRGDVRAIRDLARSCDAPGAGTRANDDAMRNRSSIEHLLIVCALGAGCGGSAKPPPPSPAASTPLAGDFEFRSEDGAVVLRFVDDGTCAVATSVEGLANPLHRCTWRLDGNRLTFTNTTGTCAESEGTRVGVYDVVVRAQDVSFTRVSDTCERRMTIDGQTWTRIAK